MCIHINRVNVLNVNVNADIDVGVKKRQRKCQGRCKCGCGCGCGGGEKHLSAADGLQRELDTEAVVGPVSGVLRWVRRNLLRLSQSDFF